MTEAALWLLSAGLLWLGTVRSGSQGTRAPGLWVLKKKKTQERLGAKLSARALAWQWYPGLGGQGERGRAAF